MKMAFRKKRVKCCCPTFVFHQITSIQIKIDGQNHMYCNVEKKSQALHLPLECVPSDIFHLFSILA